MHANYFVLNLCFNSIIKFKFKLFSNYVNSVYYYLIYIY